METLERVLREHPFLHGLDERHVEFLTACARNVRFDVGAFLHREGDDGNVIYLLRRGRVALEVHVPGKGILQVDSLGEGEVLGWSWLFPPHRWQLDARAVEPVLALALDGACVREKMDADHDFGYALAKRLLYQIYQRLGRVRLQRLDVYKTDA
jgi:CRP/FNR family cyclic AMP-dependent transcriptional regulator